MNIDHTRIDDLISGPSESLNVEIKRWISPDESEGIAKIVKAAFAIRNRNAGFFLVGFDDKTLLPESSNQPSDVRKVFHLDKLQSIVSKYASEVFEIGVGFGNRDGQEYPVIVIPEGVVTPVVAKRDLQDSAGNFLIREGDVYFRTLGSNGTPSTARARPSDWRDILEICFENREADIGRFLRRHLAGKDIQRIVELVTGLIAPAGPPSPTLRDRAEAVLNDGEQRFQAAVAARKLNPKEAAALKNGTWCVALAVEPPHLGAVPDTSFLNTVAGANPQYTGWPIWLDSRGFQDQTAAPRVVEKAWQALIISLEGWSQHIDFMRLDPKGEFFLRRILQDDLTDKIRPGTALDAILVILRVAEAIAIGISIVKALGWQDDARLGFAFRWTGLAGRVLSSWANPSVIVSEAQTAHDSFVDTFVEVPLDTPVSAIAPYVEQATLDLFVLFDGYRLPTAAIEHWVQRLIERRL